MFSFQSGRKLFNKWSKKVSTESAYVSKSAEFLTSKFNSVTKDFIEDLFNNPELQELKREKRLCLGEQDRLVLNLNEKEARIENMAQELAAIKNEIHVLDKKLNKHHKRKNKRKSKTRSSTARIVDILDITQPTDENIDKKLFAITTDSNSQINNASQQLAILSAENNETVLIDDLEAAIRAIPLEEVQAEFQKLKI